MTDHEHNTARILIIDDEPFFLELLNEALSPHYSIVLARNANQGLKRASNQNPPDLILLDIMMPDMDGYETCRLLKLNPLTTDIPVIFLTAKRDMADELKGFETGAVDYIFKPLNIPIVMIRIKTQLALAQQRLALEQLVQERTLELERTKDAIVYSMGEMADCRDEETGNHLIRTRKYVRLLAEQLHRSSRYQFELNQSLIDMYERAAPLHDIGKVQVPDSVLLKEGPLDESERAIMNQHPHYGKALIEKAEAQIGSTRFIQVAKDIAVGHHEKWDGSGYPAGLKGDAIPLSARLVALADVYDALVSKRRYKEPMSHDQARHWILQRSDHDFDPEIVSCFDQIHEQFQQISLSLKD